jgi:hypothetical protein
MQGSKYPTPRPQHTHPLGPSESAPGKDICVPQSASRKNAGRYQGDSTQHASCMFCAATHPNMYCMKSLSIQHPVWPY